MYKPDSKQDYLAQNIKLFCETNSLTYRDFVALVGISESTLHNWLKGQATPDDKRQKLLEKIFDARFDKICSNIITIRLLIDHTYTIEDIFPYNCIIAASFGYYAGTSAMSNYEESSHDDFDLNYRKISPEEFDSVFRELTYREQTVVEMRYRDSLTLDEVGKKVGVTRERVRQIEFKALRKINRDLIRFIRDVKPDIEKMMKENAELKQYITQLQSVSAQAARVETPESVKPLLLDTPIEEFDFSVRTYNCLKRAQINYAIDIVNYKDRFDYIRNLGKRSLEEIITTIESKYPAYHYNYSTHKFVLDNMSKLPEYKVN